MVNDFDYKDIEFPVCKKDYKKIEQKDKIWINVFCYENGLTYCVHISKQSLKIIWIYCWLTMKINHTMYISKVLANLCSIRQNIKVKNTDIVYNVLVVKEFW